MEELKLKSFSFIRLLEDFKRTYRDMFKTAKIFKINC